jgi:hypothetical protein
MGECVREYVDRKKSLGGLWDFSHTRTQWSFHFPERGGGIFHIPELIGLSIFPEEAEGSLIRVFCGCR